MAPQKDLSKAESFFRLKADGVEKCAKENERDPGRTSPKIKLGKLMPNSHGPKGPELGEALALAGQPNARPGGPSAGGSEGRRVPVRFGRPKNAKCSVAQGFLIILRPPVSLA